MKTGKKVILGAAAIATGIVGLALATPIVSLASPLFSVGQHPGIHLTAFFITAQGAALRTDEAAPACAAALGLT
jgi:hypothetical protein